MCEYFRVSDKCQYLIAILNIFLVQLIEMDDQITQKKQRINIQNINSNLAIELMEVRQQAQPQHNQICTSMGVGHNKQDIKMNIKQRISSIRWEISNIRNNLSENNFLENEYQRFKLLKQERYNNNEQNMDQNDKVKILTDACELSRQNIENLKSKMKQAKLFLKEFQDKNRNLQKGIEKKIKRLFAIHEEKRKKKKQNQLNLIFSNGQKQKVHQMVQQIRRQHNSQIKCHFNNQQLEVSSQLFKSTQSRHEQQNQSLENYKISPILKKKNKTNKIIIDKNQNQRLKQYQHQHNTRKRQKNKADQKYKQQIVINQMPIAIHRDKLNQHFLILGSRITLLKYQLKQNQIVLKYPMRYFFYANSFKVRIIKSKNANISIGVIDRGNTNTSYTRAATLYHGGSKQIRDKSVSTKTGEGFKQGNIIQVKLYLGQIRWIINGHLKAEYKSVKLSHQYLTFYPILEFQDQNDAIQWLTF